MDTLRKSPILSYLDEINPKDKFNYIILILCVIILSYRLSLHWSIWIGIIIGVSCVYYINERSAQTLNNSSDQLWAILKSPLLKSTKYFITDPPFIRWVDDVKEFQTLNRLEFNKMIRQLDQFLKLIYNVKIGVYQCKENLDLIQDLKVNTLNQFHSLIHKITYAALRQKFNYYFEQLGKLMNERHLRLVKICQIYYTMKPIDIDSKLDIGTLNDPTAFDKKFDPTYNYFN